jgi:hypothetical protein
MTKTYGGAEVWHYAFLNLVVDGSEWSVSFYGRLDLNQGTGLTPKHLGLIDRPFVPP